MAHSYVNNMYLTPYNHYLSNDTYNLRQSPAYFMQLKVCTTKRNRNAYMWINIWPSNTITELKEAIARYLRIELPVNKFFLEMFDENEYQWKMVDDSNSSFTINQLKLRPDSLLSIEYYDQQIPSHQRPLYSSLITNNNHEFIFKLCIKPMDKTDYIDLNISSLSTVRKLRKQAYEQLNKPSKNQPIYLSKGDSWIKFGSDMDDYILNDPTFQSYTFISIEPDEENFDSKLPAGLCGLANLGSTCFMNSVFQCLSNIPEFTKRILAFTDEVNAPIIDEYRKLTRKLWSGKYRYIDPSLLLNDIKNNLPSYANYRQQDAQEFMNHFLHLIHAEFSIEETLITDLFYGQIQSSVKCLGCQNIEITNESISFLPLPISNYNQKTVLHVKPDGEHRLVSIQIDASIYSVGDLIDCFLRQQELTLTRERILAVELVDNLVKVEYEYWQSLSRIRGEELVFLECPEKSAGQKYILCEFVDHSTGKPFRSPIILVCSSRECHYMLLSDQIDQLLGHLCSMTNAPPSACQLYWINRNGKRYELNRNDDLPHLSSITIEMATKWIDIYTMHNNINYSSDNSGLTSLLFDFFHEEPLDGDYHCSKCSKSTKARQKSNLCQPLPQVLIIQLKRFTYDIYSNNKIDAYISFPLYGLDLNEYLVKDSSTQHASNSSTKYDLVAVSNHTGNLASGHYITYAKNIQDGHWYLFDDRLVRKLNSDNDVVTKNAYILVYVRTT